MAEYTDADQRADKAFLVGVAYGRDSERARMSDVNAMAEAMWSQTPNAGELSEVPQELQDEFHRRARNVIRLLLGEEALP